VIRPAHFRARTTARCKGQEGYAILMILFLSTLILIGAMSVAPNLLIEGRREKEAEMIWRGKQYTRGIKLFYRKTGKFPTSMDDLTKPKMGSLRFMRQAYKDPMNSKDGEWRLIYVSPTGQLIGSLKPPQTLQLSGLGGQVGAVPGTPAAQMGSPSLGQGIGQAVGQVFGNSGAANSPSTSASNPSGQPPAPGPDGAPVDASGAVSDVSDAANQELLASDPTTVIGGNIIGVGSKINQRSITVFDKAKNYKQFEFIWDPSKDAITIGGAAGPQIGTPAGQPDSFGNPTNSNPNGPGAPLNPPPSPPETAPNPPQQ
jgi:hypothetical protein